MAMVMVMGRAQHLLMVVISEHVPSIAFGMATMLFLGTDSKVSRGRLYQLNGIVSCLAQYKDESSISCQSQLKMHVLPPSSPFQRLGIRAKEKATTPPRQSERRRMSPAHYPQAEAP
jgi:hypothetical protein